MIDDSLKRLAKEIYIEYHDIVKFYVTTDTRDIKDMEVRFEYSRVNGRAMRLERALEVLILHLDPTISVYPSAFSKTPNPPKAPVEIPPMQQKKGAAPTKGTDRTLPKGSDVGPHDKGETNGKQD